MSINGDILQHALAHPGQRFETSELMAAAGHRSNASSGSALLLCLLQKNAIAREGVKWHYRWFVPDNAEGRARAQAYLDKPEYGCGNRDARFNAGSPRARPRDETPREHAVPPTPSPARAPYPPEALRYAVDDDGDLMILGRDSGACYLLLPKLDAVDLLEFARRSAPHLEAA